MKGGELLADNGKPNPSDKTLCHQRYKSTNVCVHCKELLADWEFSLPCPARQNEAQRHPLPNAK